MKTNPTRSEVLRALADGLTVESCLSIGLAWNEVKTTVEFGDLAPDKFNACYWRILDPPAPKRLILLGPEDVPPGSVIRPTSHDSGWFAVTRNCGDSVFVGDCPRSIDFAELKKDWLISRDGGRSWYRCQKEEA